MSEKTKKRLFFPVCIMSVLFSCFALSRLFRRPDFDYKYRAFLGNGTDFDVLFLGTSHVLTSVFPLRLWNDHGITSYNLSAHGCSIPLSYWVFRNAVRVHKPKVAVLDIFAVAGVPFDMNLYHRTYDAIPMGAEKLRSFADLFGFKDFLKAFGFSMSHSFWSKDAYDAAETKPNEEMGAEPLFLLRFDHSFGTESREFEGRDTDEIRYVQKFIDFCRKNDIVPILTFIPFDKGQESLRPWAEHVFKKARGQGVGCLEIEKDGRIDFEIDMADVDSHLNPNGGRKVTDFIGTYLSRNCALENHKDDEAYSWWRDCYAAHRAHMKSVIKSQNDFKMALLVFDESLFFGTVHASPGRAFDRIEQKFLKERESSVSVVRSETDGVVFEIFDADDKTLVKRMSF